MEKWEKWGQSLNMLYWHHMPRIERIDVGDCIYHILNRANARSQIFDTIDDYLQFEDVLKEAVEKYDMRLLAKNGG